MSLGVGGISQTYNKSTGQTSTNGTTTNNGTTVTYLTTPTGVSSTDGSFAGATLNLPSGTTTNIPSSVPATLNVAGFTPAVPATNNTYDTNGNLLTAGTPGTAASFTAPTTVSDTLNSLIGLTNTGSTSRVATAVFSSSDFGVVLSALKTQDNTKIVSNPTIVTLNNTEASINIGQEFPVPSYTYNSERGSFEVSGFTYKPIGINLKVTPQVNARGVIKMTIEPEVSQQNGSTSFGGAGGAQIPIVATRKVSTHVSLKDGYTMGIGGLITTSTEHGGTKVPILGDIPLLGRLFSSKNTNDVSTNLLIFITAKTVSADGASPEEVFDPRAIAAVGMTKEDLPGNRAPAGTDLFKPAPAPKPDFIRFKDGSDILTPISK
jgi:type IV pilus assembly protein PilQ